MTPECPTPRPVGPIVLASASPRRRELLTRADVSFEVRPADIDEVQNEGESPRDLAVRLAHEKAETVARLLAADEARPVLGADTIVVLGDRVLGKPRDRDHAVELLGSLLGHRHSVITGVAVVRPADLAVRSIAVESLVTMRTADAEEVRRYVEGGEPLDKAGAYAVQGEGRKFVLQVEGSETNVIGLPVDETLALLRANDAAEATA